MLVRQPQEDALLKPIQRTRKGKTKTQTEEDWKER